MNIDYDNTLQGFDFILSELHHYAQGYQGEIRLELCEFDINDAYLIERSAGLVRIQSNTMAGLLHASYVFLKHTLGWDFSHMGAEVKRESLITTTPLIEGSPLFKRRGNVVEEIYDVDYLLSLIDYNAKAGVSQMFFTFHSWDAVVEAIADELEKRFYTITLGGHSLEFLLKDKVDIEKSADTNVSVFVDARYQKIIIDKIVAMCAAHPMVNRISLWPQDIGIKRDKGEEFMNNYLHFSELLKENLDGIEVEHIVYNAGLAWEMLEKSEAVKQSDQLDILYAYWGRDYSQNINQSPRAIKALKDWNHKTEFTVFEYYSDFFMLSELFPPLAQRIYEDTSDYANLGVDGLVNLIVPLLPSQYYEMIKDHYPWQQIHLFNNFMYHCAVWNIPMEDALNQWFDHDEPRIMQYLKLETVLAKVSAYNQVLFPKRLVDVPDNVDKNEVIALLKAVKDEIINFEEDIYLEWITTLVDAYIKLYGGVV